MFLEEVPLYTPKGKRASAQSAYPPGIFSVIYRNLAEFTYLQDGIQHQL